MATPQQEPAPTLELRRTFRASKERVFAAWTQKEALSLWFAPSPDYACQVHSLDVRVGGSYRIEMRHRNGATHVVVGEYREVSPPDRLRFTWRWEENPATPETLVTVSLHPQGDGTEVVLVHQGFAAVKERDDHHKGWTGCLDRLGTAL